MQRLRSALLICLSLCLVAGCARPAARDVPATTQPLPAPAAATPSPAIPAPASGSRPTLDPARAAGLAGTITIDGSSTVFPITEAVAAEFRAAAPGVAIQLGVSGTGGGFKKFCAGQI